MLTIVLKIPNLRYGIKNPRSGCLERFGSHISMSISVVGPVREWTGVQEGWLHPEGLASSNVPLSLPLVTLG